MRLFFQRFVSIQQFWFIGQKLIVAGSVQGTLQGANCDDAFYQPFQFLSSMNSRYAYRTSYCSEEGQTIFSNGSTLRDRLCRCDYTKSYDFIVRPKHRCYCVPTEEDCSCHLKTCSSNDMLSPGMHIYLQHIFLNNNQNSLIPILIYTIFCY